MSHAHVQRLLGRQGHVTGKQGWLLHDGIVMAAMGMGIPPVGQGLRGAHRVRDDCGVLYRGVGELLPCWGQQDLLGTRGPGLLCEKARLDLQGLTAGGLSHYGNSILHPYGVAAVLGGGCLQPLEGGWANNERLLEGVRPSGTELSGTRLQGHGPGCHGSHGCCRRLVECRLVV